MECDTWEYLISFKVSNEEKMGLKVQNEVILRARSIAFLKLSASAVAKCA